MQGFPAFEEQAPRRLDDRGAARRVRAWPPLPRGLLRLLFPDLRPLVAEVAPVRPLLS